MNSEAAAFKVIFRAFRVFRGLFHSDFIVFGFHEFVVEMEQYEIEIRDALLYNLM